MSSQKERNLTRIVREFVKNGDTYDITGIDLGLAKYFWRETKELFQDLAVGDYRIDTSNGQQRLIITNTDLLGRLEAIQVGYTVDFDASKYDTQWNVDVNILKDKYNQLIDTCDNLWEYIRLNGFISDDTTMNLILPQLDNDQFWIMQDGQYRGFDISDFRELGERLIEAYVEYQKGLLEILFRNARENIITTKENSITEIQGLLDALNINVDNFTGDKKLELQRIIDGFKAELATIEVGNANTLQGYQPMNFERVEPTIASLQANRRYKVGDIVEVLGYYEKGDGANHKRKIESTDDGSGVQLSSGLWANVVHNGEVNVSWLGAKGDGVTDDTVAIQKAIDFSDSVILEGKTYAFQDININKTIRGFKIEGKGMEKSVLKCIKDDGVFNVNYINKFSDYVFFKNFSINGNDKLGAFRILTNYSDFENFSSKFCKVYSLYSAGLENTFRGCNFTSSDSAIQNATVRVVWNANYFSNTYFNGGLGSKVVIKVENDGSKLETIKHNFSDCTIETGRVVINNSQSIMLKDNYMEDSKIECTGSLNGLKIKDNHTVEASPVIALSSLNKNDFIEITGNDSGFKIEINVPNNKNSVDNVLNFNNFPNLEISHLTGRSDSITINGVVNCSYLKVNSSSIAGGKGKKEIKLEGLNSDVVNSSVNILSLETFGGTSSNGGYYTKLLGISKKDVGVYQKFVNVSDIILYFNPVGGSGTGDLTKQTIFEKKDFNVTLDHSYDSANTRYDIKATSMETDNINVQSALTIKTLL